MQDLAVSNVRARGKGSIEYSVEFDKFEMLANKCQTSMRAKVIGQFFDKKFSRRNLTCRVRSITPLNH